MPGRTSSLVQLANLPSLVSTHVSHCPGRFLPCLLSHIQSRCYCWPLGPTDCPSRRRCGVTAVAACVRWSDLLMRSCSVASLSLSRGSKVESVHGVVRMRAAAVYARRLGAGAEVLPASTPVVTGTRAGFVWRAERVCPRPARNVADPIQERDSRTRDPDLFGSQGSFERKQ